MNAGGTRFPDGAESECPVCRWPDQGLAACRRCYGPRVAIRATEVPAAIGLGFTLSRLVAEIEATEFVELSPDPISLETLVVNDLAVRREHRVECVAVYHEETAHGTADDNADRARPCASGSPSQHRRAGSS